MNLKQTIAHLVAKHLNSYPQQEQLQILAGLSLIVDFKLEVDKSLSPICLDDFQSLLSKLNEKESRRRDEGVYYTPKDVTEYIVANAFLNWVNPDNSQVYSTEQCLSKIRGEKSFKIQRARICDPTCGTAEFLLSAIHLKLASSSCLGDAYILSIISTIFGNDIAQESILLSKIRLFFAIVSLLKDKTKVVELARILNKNLTTFDFISTNKFRSKFDIVVGNPPYIEYSKLPIKPIVQFGNTYANVLKNSIETLHTNGVIGFIIPISFVATPRMKEIRDYSYSQLSKLFVLNFADRPDCLFDGVHQKLAILLGQKGKNNCRVFSSSYYHWYSKERESLLDSTKVFRVFPKETYIPKIGNQYEQSIFEKIVRSKGETLNSISYSSVREGVSIYLNMRGCFWIKAFSFNPGSNEYKRFYCPASLQPYLICLLNSNLFFLFWTVVSDCWHITSKELSGFIIPIDGINYECFRNLSDNLERRLEETKKYVGSKQTTYEYKHKDCKKEIDNIDVALQSIYHLTDEEISFLRDYKVRYRTSNG